MAIIHWLTESMRVWDGGLTAKIAKAKRISNNTVVILKEYLDILWRCQQTMPKVSLDMPAQILEDLKLHVGDDGKFVSVADAIRTAVEKCSTN